MLVHPQFDPVALHIGPLAIRWYGLMYLVAFTQFVLLGRWRIAQRQPGQPLHGFTGKDVEDLMFYGVLGAVIGGRLGHVLFYGLSYYLAHPLHIFYVWEGGMAFHGGLVGVLLSCALFAHRRGVRWLDLMDFVAPLVPLGLAAGRLGNYINGELWGRVTDVPWGMVFPQSGSALPRHPSQLYELAAEGRTMVVVTHELGFAREVSSHVMFLHQGQIEEEGRPEKLFYHSDSERVRQFLSNSLKG